jgi:aminoglycoside 2'-N-acetyltransferase I
VPELRRFTTAAAPPGRLAEIRRLADAAFDDFTDEDWEHALGGLHAVALDGGAVVAHASVVPRRLELAGRPVHAGYVEAVATAAEQRGRGLGSLVMGAIGEEIRARYELGALATGAFGFYARLGWERWRGPSYVRRGGGLERTAGDDGAIMVLRFGPSAGADLGAAIACEERPGDDW